MNTITVVFFIIQSIAIVLLFKMVYYQRKKTNAINKNIDILIDSINSNERHLSELSHKISIIPFECKNPIDDIADPKECREGEDCDI